MPPSPDRARLDFCYRVLAGTSIGYAAIRDLTRYRKSPIQERAREASRLHKVLEDANIKLSSVATEA